MRYVSCGYVVLKDDRLGVKYLPITEYNNIIDEPDKTLIFKSDKSTRHPVGWIINITESEKGYSIEPSKVKDGNMIRYEQIDNKSQLEKYMVQSKLSREYILIERAKKKMHPVDIFDNMTLTDMKSYVSDSPMNRYALIMFLIKELSKVR